MKRNSYGKKTYQRYHGWIDLQLAMPQRQH